MLPILHCLNFVAKNKFNDILNTLKNESIMCSRFVLCNNAMYMYKQIWHQLYYYNSSVYIEIINIPLMAIHSSIIKITKKSIKLA